MTFQKAFAPFLVVSLVITFVARRLLGTLLPSWCLPGLVLCNLIVLYIAAVAYTISLRPFFSTLQNLPTAPQPPVWRRLFKEPGAYHFEKWFREVPNDGLIRYYGVFNIEKVLVTSPTYAKQILQTDAYSYEKQYGQRTHLERVGGRGLVWQEGQTHQYLRRALEPSFKTSLVKDDYFAPIAQKTGEMLRLLREMMNSQTMSLPWPGNNVEPASAILELDEVIHKTVFDIMGLVAFGPEMDFQSIFRPELYYNPLKDYRLAFKPSTPNKVRVYAAFFLPTWAVNLLPIRFNFTTGLAIRHFRHIGKDWIDRQKSLLLHREKPLPSSTSFIMKPIILEGKLSDQDLLEQFSMFQAGGIHSTGAAMMSAVWWLAHPINMTVQRELRSEIRSKIQSADARTWSSPQILDSCHYLNAVISEVLRLHPPFSWLGRTPKRWMQLGDTALPPGLSISISAWAAHRDPEVWGEDANMFRPERWLQKAPSRPSDNGMPSRASSLPHSDFLSFGKGPRRCIAKNLARMELQCVLAALFGQYEFQAIAGVELPRVTHQSTLALTSELRLRTILVEGWGE